jgi:phospholipid/cholesterol/gamma-HCH transport system ATP-binding protein
MISVIDLHKQFEDNVILDSVTVDFEKGKTNLIIGQSGSGKTVLLKSIVGLHFIDKGQVLYDGRDLHAMSHRKKRTIRREMGMLFQGSALFDSYSVADNVRFPLDVFSNMTRKEKEKRVAFCLDRVNLKNVNDLLPSEISGGMQKRVAIARAISVNPQYLFCDEPNSGLDPKTAVVIDELIMELTHEFDMTTIINTHDINSMVGIGEKIVFINNKQAEWIGDNHSLLNTTNETLYSFLHSSKIIDNLSN